MIEAKGLSGAKTVEPEVDRGGIAGSFRCSFESVDEKSLQLLQKTDHELNRREYGIWTGVEPNQKKSK